MEAPKVVKENPVMSAFLALLAAGNVGGIVTMFNIADSIATEAYVEAELAVYTPLADFTRQVQSFNAHVTQTDTQMQSIDSELRRVRAYTEIVPQLKDLMALRCMGTRGLDDTIDTLKRQYTALTREVFDEGAWPCERLLVR